MDYQKIQVSKYSFGKMNSYKCKLNFKILQINLAIGSTNIIGFINLIHYIDNNFTTCCEQFHELVPMCATLQNQIHEMYNNLYFTTNNTSCIRFS